MQTVQLTPKPGQINISIGGTVLFTSPNAPNVASGDMWFMTLLGQPPGRANLGHAMPWDTQIQYDGTVGSDGTMTVSGECTASGGPFSVAAGVNVAVGVLPSGQVLFGYFPTIMVPVGPAPPPPSLGMANLVAKVIASAQTGVAIADLNTQCDKNVTYMCQEPYMTGPQPAVVPWSLCLGLAASNAIAALLGGSVDQEPVPIGEWISPPVGAPPLVNWIKFSDNGIAKKALAAHVAQAFAAGNPAISIPAAFVAA